MIDDNERSRWIEREKHQRRGAIVAWIMVGALTLLTAASALSALQIYIRFNASWRFAEFAQFISREVSYTRYYQGWECYVYRRILLAVFSLGWLLAYLLVIAIVRNERRREVKLWSHIRALEAKSPIRA